MKHLCLAAHQGNEPVPQITPAVSHDPPQAEQPVQHGSSEEEQPEPDGLIETKEPEPGWYCINSFGDKRVRVPKVAYMETDFFWGSQTYCMNRFRVRFHDLGFRFHKNLEPEMVTLL